MGTTYVCQRCHNKFTNCKLVDGADYGHYLMDQGWFSKGNWYCNSCYEAAKREFKASKKAAKAVKASAGDSGSCGGGGASSDDEPIISSGCGTVIGKLITFAGVVFIVLVILGLIFGKAPEDVNDKDQMMKLWLEHLEKRCEAFSEGLSEEGVNARGLKNYTWDEWMAFKRKEHGVTSEKTSGVSMSEIAKDLGNKAMAALQGNGPKEEENPEETLKKLNARLAELEGDGKSESPQRKASNSASYKVTVSGNEAIVIVTSEYTTRSDAWQGAARMAVKAAVSAFVGDPKVVQNNKDRFEERLDSVSKADLEQYQTFKDLQEGSVFTVGIKAKFRKGSLALKFKDVFPETFSNVDGKPSNSVSRQTSDSGQQNGGSQRASKDSKGLRIVVQGKGKTKEAALNNAFRQAVWKTVCIWVDSKTRIQENRDKMIALVEAIGESDLTRYEMMESQQQDGMFVVKVRVSVTKQKIAPKFTKLFPDVFEVGK